VRAAQSTPRFDTTTHGTPCWHTSAGIATLSHNGQSDFIVHEITSGNDNHR
jgi:hypothetical protein